VVGGMGGQVETRCSEMAVERHGSVGKRNEQRPGWGQAARRRPIRQPSACPTGESKRAGQSAARGTTTHGYDLRCEMRWRSDAPVAAGSWRGSRRGSWRGSWALGVVGLGSWWLERECSMWRLACWDPSPGDMTATEPACAAL
jgi:hypothetical protein